MGRVRGREKEKVRTKIEETEKKREGAEKTKEEEEAVKTEEEGGVVPVGQRQGRQ